MSDSAVPHDARFEDPPSYSGNLRNLLFGAAFLVALFPIPVTAFGLLPTYQQHARFLILYTPVVCLLAVGYLFYLRDSLARLLFADLIRPLQNGDEYQDVSLKAGAAKVVRRLRAVLVALLPALLLAGSFYCFTGYTRQFSESLELTTAVVSPPAAFQEHPGGPPDPSGSHAATLPATLEPSREEVLRTADLDSIMNFGKLTALYMGIFVAALMAITVMALKEHAAQAMGLSEHALLLGAWDEQAETLDELSHDVPFLPHDVPPPAREAPSLPPSPLPRDVTPPSEATDVRPIRAPASNGPVAAPPGWHTSAPPPEPKPAKPPATKRSRYSMEPREPE